MCSFEERCKKVMSFFLNLFWCFISNRAKRDQAPSNATKCLSSVYLSAVARYCACSLSLSLFLSLFFRSPSHSYSLCLGHVSLSDSAAAEEEEKAAQTHSLLDLTSLCHLTHNLSGQVDKVTHTASQPLVIIPSIHPLSSSAAPAQYTDQLSREQAQQS